MSIPWDINSKFGILIPLAMLSIGGYLIVQSDKDDDSGEVIYHTEGQKGKRPGSTPVNREDKYAAPNQASFVGARKRAPRARPTESENPVIDAKQVISEMRRIIRAGRSMKSLRSTSNGVLQDRCQTGSNELNRWISALAEKSTRVSLPADTYSMSDVIVYTKACIQCDETATAACTQAERALTSIAAGLN